LNNGGDAQTLAQRGGQDLSRQLSVATLLLAVTPPTVLGHSFGRLYTLPVPFWLYAWTAVATLILSFVLVGWLASRSPKTGMVSEVDISETVWVRLLRRFTPALKLLSAAVLLLVITTAIFGNRDPYRNFSMIAFWIIFILGTSYITAVIGNFYAVLNPWRVIVQTLGRWWPKYIAGRVQYPVWLGDWPALSLYLGFIAYELFAAGRPHSLGIALLGYTAINLFGVWLIGACSWFRHGEFFAVFLRLIGLLAPLNYRPASRTLHYRQPFSGMWTLRPAAISTVVFVLAMLSTTAFDGLSATRTWVQLFWADPYGLVTPLVGAHPMQSVAATLPWYFGWQSLCLLLSPFLYFFAYLLALAIAKGLIRSNRSLRDLALDFGYSLLPIALVYNMTHYATLLLSDGLKIISLFSDPFGWGWDLFGTAWKFRAPILPDMSWVWHAQVGLILAGHVLSVYVAHRIALNVFASRRRAIISQLPMLVLMVAFTVAGLWILAQPLTVERMT